MAIAAMLDEYGMRERGDSAAVKSFILKCAEGSNFERIDYDKLSMAVTGALSVQGNKNKSADNEQEM